LAGPFKLKTCPARLATGPADLFGSTGYLKRSLPPYLSQMGAEMTREIERAVSALMHLDSGCKREEWIKTGMAAKASGVSFEDFHQWSALASNYAGERDCRSVWASFSETGPVTAGSLFAMAFAQGWQDTAKRQQAANGSRIGTASTAPKKTPVTPIKETKIAKAAQVWECCEPAPANHAYIARKGGLPDGLRVYP
jgi:putative DNA primase/helicase